MKASSGKFTAWLKNYSFTIFIILAMTGGLLFPEAFTQWGELKLTNKMLMLIVVQSVMFGMGTQMSLQDLQGIRKMGKPVLIGISSQFLLMPFIGLGLVLLFDFEPEISAGIILIGSCSSGLASNVMTYMAKGNLPLSVTLTTLATLMAPVMTPLWMKVLAGTYVQISFMAMFTEIIKIVVVPIGAAMWADFYTHAKDTKTRQIINFITMAAIIVLSSGIILSGILTPGMSPILLTIFELLLFLMGALIVGRLYYSLQKMLPKIKTLMPKISMAGIIYFTAVTTAASSDNILKIGFLIFLAAMLHNTLGYLFGYWVSRLFGIEKHSARTIAFEVGMQNGAMASGLAGMLGKLSTMGLAAAIFSPWMNISGSVLANYWRKVKNEK